MRAIIRCNAKTTKESMKGVLATCQWMPPLEETDPEVILHHDQILSLVAPEDAGIVKATVWFMIYHHPLRTWGLVNSPQPGLVEIRLRNQSSPQLRRACEQLITDLETASSSNSARPTFEFADTIEVLEPNSQHHAYYGEPLPTKIAQKWQLAKMERKSEWVVGCVLLGAAVLFMLLTLPPIQKYLTGHWPTDWTEWGGGFFGRLSTSALASSAVSFMGVVIHYFDLRRVGAVRWSFRHEHPQ